MMKEEKKSGRWKMEGFYLRRRQHHRSSGSSAAAVIGYARQVLAVKVIVTIMIAMQHQLPVKAAIEGPAACFRLLEIDDSSGMKHDQFVALLLSATDNRLVNPSPTGRVYTTNMRGWRSGYKAKL